MTPEQRERIQYLIDYAPSLKPYDLDALAAALADLDAATTENAWLREKLASEGGGFLAKALADLDACRKALGPVARALQEPYQALRGKDLRTACLTLAETAAVLAAAGEGS